VELIPGTQVLRSLELIPGTQVPGTQVPHSGPSGPGSCSGPRAARPCSFPATVAYRPAHRGSPRFMAARSTTIRAWRRAGSPLASAEVTAAATA